MAIKNCLTIAGSDSGGGAGIQADLKTFAALGCYGCSAITALTAQNTQGVQAVFPITSEFVRAQIHSIMTDIDIASVKIGMVHNLEIAQSVFATLAQFPACPVIFDPVMVATSGAALMTEDSIKPIKQLLQGRITLLTPNIPEAEMLLGKALPDYSALQQAAAALAKELHCNVYLKGGHFPGETIIDLIYEYSSRQLHTLTSPAIKTKNLHGSGCTLSSAIAACLTREENLLSACQQAHAYVQQAILQNTRLRVGQGYGPLQHFPTTLSC